MSRKANEPRKDRRIQKTQRLLHEALASLIREKPYDAIAVTEILDRADVGRSTFYMHYRDKDDLLVSGIRDMVAGARSVRAPRSGKLHERLIWFSLPIFEHHHRHQQAGQAKMGPRGRAVLHEHLQRMLADLVADEFKKDSTGRRKPGAFPPDLIVQYVASTFVLVLNWWLESKTPLAPNEADALFRALVLPALAALPTRDSEREVGVRQADVRLEVRP